MYNVMDAYEELSKLNEAFDKVTKADIEHRRAAFKKHMAEAKACKSAKSKALKESIYLTDADTAYLSAIGKELKTAGYEDVSESDFYCFSKDITVDGHTVTICISNEGKDKKINNFLIPSVECALDDAYAETDADVNDYVKVFKDALKECTEDYKKAKKTVDDKAAE